MKNLDNEINQTHRKVNELMAAGYTRLEAIQLIQATAQMQLAGCVTQYNYKDYLRIMGSMATYEQ